MSLKTAKKHTHKTRWLPASLIVVALTLVGYVGYQQSGAESFNNTPPTVNCKNLTKKQCNRQQAESDAQFYAQLNKDCTAANRIFNNNACGGCQKGFFDKDGTCKARQKANCVAQFRFQKDDYTCGKCIGGYYDKNDVCTKLAAQATDSCAQLGAAGCVAPNVPNSPSTITPTCGDNQRFNSTTGVCECRSGYALLQGACQETLTQRETCALSGNGKCLPESAVKQICADRFLQYGNTLNRCEAACISGYYNKDGICRQANHSQDEREVIATCNQQFLKYDAAGNVCANSCKDGYVKRDGKCVDQSGVLAMSEQRCRALGRTWVPAVSLWGASDYKPAYCSNNCLDGDTAQFVDTTRDLTSYCRNDGSDSLSVSLALSANTCADQHRLYLSAIQACSARCQSGWYADNGVCQQIKTNVEEPATGDGGDAGCAAPLQDGIVLRGVRPTVDTVSICPDDSPNQAPAVTTADRPVRHVVEPGIDHATCTMLGRMWVPDSSTTQGGCSQQGCLLGGAEARNANGSVYCEGSVDRISYKACLASHRQWLPEVKACAARLPQAATKRINAPQCQSPYTVYVRHTNKQGDDECVKPTMYQRLRGVAEKTGKPVSYLASLAPKALCKTQKNKQWIDGRCVKKRVADEVGKSNADKGGTKKNPQLISCSAFHDLFNDYYCTFLVDVPDDRACLEGTLVTPKLQRGNGWWQPTSAVCKGAALGATGLTVDSPQDVRCRKFITYFSERSCPIADNESDARVCPVGQFATITQQFMQVFLRSKVCVTRSA